MEGTQTSRICKLIVEKIRTKLNGRLIAFLYVELASPICFRFGVYLIINLLSLVHLHGISIYVELAPPSPPGTIKLIEYH